MTGLRADAVVGSEVRRAYLRGVTTRPRTDYPIVTTLAHVCLALTVLVVPGCSTRPTAGAAGPTSGERSEVALTARAPVVPFEASSPDRPRNVVLMIGDGMGLTQITAAMYAGGNALSLERMPVVGLHKSYSSDNLITDSAAGATAFSCGVKTYNGAIGVRPDTSACYTVLERAEDGGMPTGLVATSTIVHATPAAFYAHVPSRQDYPAIAAQLTESGVDFFVGGGQEFFSRRADGRDLLAEMHTGGRTVDSYFDKGVEELLPHDHAGYGYLTADGDPLPFAGGRNYFPRATELALDYLSARDSTEAGFFLLVEGSQIDWGGHANDSDYIISETQEFAEVIGRVLDFAAADGETLVVVTADHETGGYAVNPGSTMGDIEGAFTSDYHTADLIPVFAFGPGAEAFAGIYENTAIHDKLVALKFGGGEVAE